MRLYSISEDEGEKMDELFTITEVAKTLRVDETTVRRWVKQGLLEAVVLPHRNKRHVYRIKKKTVDSIVARS